MALFSVKVGISAVKHFSERHNMKKRDKEIEDERQKEREMELQTSETILQHKTVITHFSHQHPLHKNYSNQTFECKGCDVTSASGWAYTCEVSGCSYSLHAVCSGTPMTLKPTMGNVDGAPHQHHATGSGSSSFATFAHRLDHSVKDVYSNLEFQCDHCFTGGKGRRYKCGDCNVDLHPVCAKHPTRISTFMHPQHELELRTKKRFKACQICGHSLKAGEKALNLRVYGCDECEFWVHPLCSQLPQYLLHDLHPMTDPPHPLQLKRISSSATSTQCDAKCGSNCTTGWQYACSLCSVSFHIHCILQHSVPDKSEKRLPNMIGIFLELADAAGFVLDVASFLS